MFRIFIYFGNRNQKPPTIITRKPKKIGDMLTGPGHFKLAWGDVFFVLLEARHSAPESRSCGPALDSTDVNVIYGLDGLSPVFHKADTPSVRNNLLKKWIRSEPTENYTFFKMSYHLCGGVGKLIIAHLGSLGPWSMLLFVLFSPTMYDLRKIFPD